MNKKIGFLLKLFCCVFSLQTMAAATDEDPTWSVEFVIHKSGVSNTPVTPETDFSQIFASGADNIESISDVDEKTVIGTRGLMVGNASTDGHITFNIANSSRIFAKKVVFKVASGNDLKNPLTFTVNGVDTEYQTSTKDEDIAVALNENERLDKLAISIKHLKGTGTFNIKEISVYNKDGIYFSKGNVRIKANDQVDNPLINPGKILVVYSSSEPTVAEVDSHTGQVTVRKPGKTTITAESEDSSSEDKCSYDLVITSYGDVPSHTIENRYLKVTDKSEVNSDSHYIFISNGGNNAGSVYAMGKVSSEEVSDRKVFAGIELPSVDKEEVKDTYVFADDEMKLLSSIRFDPFGNSWIMKVDDKYFRLNHNSNSFDFDLVESLNLENHDKDEDSLVKVDPQGKNGVITFWRIYIFSDHQNGTEGRLCAYYSNNENLAPGYFCVDTEYSNPDVLLYKRYEPEIIDSPIIVMDDESGNDLTYDIENNEWQINSNKSLNIRLTHEDSADIYYRYVNDNSQETEQVQRAAGEYQLYNDYEGISFPTSGSLEFYGISNYNPSRLEKLRVSITTGIDSLSKQTETAPTYFNLQGIKVNKLAHGVYIKVQNGKVEKISR